MQPLIKVAKSNDFLLKDLEVKPFFILIPKNLYGFLRFGYSVRKTLSLVILHFVLLTNYPVVGEILSPVVGESLSPAEKIKYIEKIATSFSKKRTFYRWQSESSKEGLLRSGTITPNLYNYFIRKKPEAEGRVGRGIYVAEDMYSSSNFGKTVIEVEVTPDVKYIDLTDKKVFEALKAKGIDRKDISKLNPNIAVKYTDFTEGVYKNNNSGWWVLKAKEGVAFKPFSKSAEEVVKGVHTAERAAILLSKTLPFPKSVKEEIAKKSIPLIQSANEGVLLLATAKTYLNEEDLKIIAKKSVPLVKTMNDGARLVKAGGDHLSKKDTRKIMGMIRKKIPSVRSVDEAIHLLKFVGQRLDKKDINLLIKSALPPKSHLSRAQKRAVQQATQNSVKSSVKKAINLNNKLKCLALQLKQNL